MTNTSDSLLGSSFLISGSPGPEDRPIALLYGVVIVLGTFGNALVVKAVISRRPMQSTTNLLVACVAVADLVSLLCFVPFAILMVCSLPKGFAGTLLCWLFQSTNIASVTSSVSIATLSLIAIERYNALLRPMKQKTRLRRENMIYWIPGIWIYSILLTLPLFIYTHHDDTKQACLRNFNSIGKQLYFATFGVGFLLAIAVIIFCYTRIIKGLYFSKTICSVAHVTVEEEQNKRKIVKLLVVLTATFLAFLAPRMVYFLFFSATRGLFHKLSLFFLQCNSAVNPIILAHQSSNFREAFGDILKSLARKTGFLPKPTYPLRTVSTRVQTLEL